MNIDQSDTFWNRISINNTKIWQCFNGLACRHEISCVSHDLLMGFVGAGEIGETERDGDQEARVMKGGINNLQMNN